MQNGQGLKLTTHLYPVTEVKNVWSYISTATCLYGVTIKQCHSLKPEVRRNNEQKLPPISQRTQSASITKGNRFVSFEDKIAVYCVS